MLKPHFSFYLLAATAFVQDAGAARSAESVGLIASLSGTVQVIGAGDKVTKASLMQALPNGSRVKVAPGGRATVILFQNGARYELAPGSVASVAPGVCRSVSGASPRALAALPIRQMKLLAGSQVASGRAASTIMRTGASAHIELQSLSATSIRESRPVFAWRAVRGATSYKVRLWNDEDQIIWQGEATGQTTGQAASGRLAYPTTAVALAPETDYLWTVTTIIGDKPFKGEGVFRILDAEKNRAAQSELDALDGAAETGDEAMKGVLRAEIFVRYELWDDAIATYEQLAAKFPDSEAFQESLTRLLAGQARSRPNLAASNSAPDASTPNPAVPAISR